MGEMYWLKGYDIPQMSRTSAGRAIANVLSLKAEEKITSIIPVRAFGGEQNLLMATRRGLVKKTLLEEYSRPRTGGNIRLNLHEGDTPIRVVFTQPRGEGGVSTPDGMGIPL